MKITLTVAIFLFTSVLADSTTEDVKSRLKQSKDKCQLDPKTAVDQEGLQKYISSKGKEPAPENIGPHVLCVSKEMKWQKTDGTVNKQYLKERLSLIEKDAAKVEQFLKTCAVDKDSEVETAKNLFSCYEKHVSTYN
ncbi:uncharacterized protein [Euwallacea fornicatus]|uniref:uncharacterized protein n=1 Tax=Euwallacea fornicatus TaxID=995702 RepID=UPI00338EDE42